MLFLSSIIRTEEKLLLNALNSAGLAFSTIDVRKKIFDRTHESGLNADLVLNRCISQTQSLASVRYFESLGLTCVNSSSTIALSGDKQAMTLALQAARIPTPSTIFALDTKTALQATEQMGYPVVLKPTTGSWGRLVVKAHDRNAAEAVLDLREQLTGPQHRLHYIQKFIETGNSDLRAITLDGRIIAAYRRRSNHWITNASRGATGEKISISTDLEELCRATSEVAGGGILSIDLFETDQSGLLVNEVNHTTEFALATDVTGVNIASEIVNYLKARL
nr:lysine biosynthesis protein LysX [Ruegeria atlantica]